MKIYATLYNGTLTLKLTDAFTQENGWSSSALRDFNIIMTSNAIRVIKIVSEYNDLKPLIDYAPTIHSGPAENQWILENFGIDLNEAIDFHGNFKLDELAIVDWQNPSTIF